MIRLNGVSRVYRRPDVTVRALDNVSVEFAHTGLVLITGENGCGKSTLLNVIGGLDSPDEGSVETEGGFSSTERARSISYIFQSANLVSSLTVLQNIELVADDESAARSALDKVRMSEYADRMPHELSLGQQQRVGIARAIAKNDPIILADEPTSSLDPETRRDISEALTELAKTRLVIAVTHYPQDFGRVDRRIVMEAGRIISDSGDNGGELRGLPPKRVKKDRKRFLAAGAWYRIKRHRFRFALNAAVLFLGLFCISFTVSAGSLDTGRQLINQALICEEIYIVSDSYKDVEEAVPVTPYSIGDVRMLLSANDNAYLKAFVYAGSQIMFTDASLISGEDLLTGEMPEGKDEIAVSQYIADVLTYDSDNGINDYEDVLEKGEITYENFGCTATFDIVGIVADDGIKAYDSLKGVKPTPENDILVKELGEMISTTMTGAVYALNGGVDALRPDESVLDGVKGTQDRISDDIYEDMVNAASVDIDELTVIGNTEGALLPLEYSTGISYAQWCYDHPDPEERASAIIATIDDREMEFFISGWTDDSLSIFPDPYKGTYYFDATVPVTGYYVEDPSSAIITYRAVIIPENVYTELGGETAGPKSAGPALFDMSGIDSADEFERYVIDNEHIVSWAAVGENMISESVDTVNWVVVACWCIGAASLIFALVFMLYSISQYFRQNAPDLGIMMSLGISKAYCLLYVLSEYLIMTAACTVAAMALAVTAPMILNAFCAGGAVVVNIFVFYASTIGYIAAYSFGLTILSAVGAAIGLIRRPPIQMISDRA